MARRRFYTAWVESPHSKVRAGRSAGGASCSYGPSLRRSPSRTDATARLLHQQASITAAAVYARTIMGLHDRHCRFSVFLELLNCHTLGDAGYCAAANVQHGHPSDRARTAKDSHAIGGDVSTVSTFAVRPGLLGIERSAATRRSASPTFPRTPHLEPARRHVFGPAAIRQASRMLIDSDHPTGWSDPARLGIAGVRDFGSLMARHPSDTGTYRWNR